MTRGYGVLTHVPAAHWIVQAREAAGARAGTSPPGVGAGERAND